MMCKLLFGIVVVPLLLSTTSFRINKKKKKSRVIIDGALKSIVGKLNKESSLIAYGKGEALNSAGGSIKAHNTPAHEIDYTGDLSLVALAGKQEKAFTSVASGDEEHNTSAHETNYSEDFSLVTQLASSDVLEHTGSIGKGTFEARTAIAQSHNMSSPINAKYRGRQVMLHIDEDITKERKLGMAPGGGVYPALAFEPIPIGGETEERPHVQIAAWPFPILPFQHTLDVAIKKELKPGLMLRHEARVLLDLQGTTWGVPKLLIEGTVEMGDEVWMVTEWLREDLEAMKGSVRPEGVPILAEQMFKILSRIHTKYLHCDISPQHVMNDFDMQHLRLVLVDFGLSRKPGFQNAGQLDQRGSRSYMSINAMLGHPRTYRDDLISTIYMLLYLAKPSGVELPWTGLKVPEEKQHQVILDKKQELAHSIRTDKLAQHEVAHKILPALWQRFVKALCYYQKLEDKNVNLTTHEDQLSVDSARIYSEFIKIFKGA